jgi:hypothetical protein
MSPASLGKFDLSDPDVVVYCTECASPYARTVEACVTCGASSFWSREEVQKRLEEFEKGPNFDDPAELVVAQNPEEAHAVREALREAQIRFAELTQGQSSLFSSPEAGVVRFLVESRDLERADKVVDAVEELFDAEPAPDFDAPDDGDFGSEGEDETPR